MLQTLTGRGRFLVVAAVSLAVMAVFAAAETVWADQGGRTVISGRPWVAGTGGQKVVYGTDDRIDVYQETDPVRKALAGSVCALLNAAQLTYENGTGIYRISTSAYEYLGSPPCAGEPFANQPTAPFCTGFLVGGDLVATAGHCYSTNDIAGVRFVFGFEMKDATTPNLEVQASQVYSGIQVVGRQLDQSNGLDFAIVRLDRAVTAPGAVALPLRRSGTVALNTLVGVMGHPSGLPKKIAFGAATHVTDNAATGYFKANLDTYGGNSGSPVFDAATGVVEGILVRGNTDFVISGDCFVSNTLPDSTTDAEQVSKSVTFAPFVPDSTVQVTVPGVTGLTLEAATTALMEAGLNTGTLTQQCSDSVAAGLVTSQNPAVGQRIAFGSAVALVISTGKCKTKTPNVTGKTVEEAEALLAAAGLAAGTVSQRCSNDTGTGLIMLQDPAAGEEVNVGMAVALVVSTGRCNTTVPNVTGMTQEAAGAALAAADLSISGVTAQCHPSIAPGLVITQNPAAGAPASIGGTVGLTISNGPCSTTVPQVIGLTRTEAVTALTAASLAMGTVTEACSETTAANRVIVQTPEPGTPAANGSTVDFVVSTGPCSTTMPEVTGMTQAAAGTAIVAAQLAVSAIDRQCSDSVGAGFVISQNPAAGTTLAVGSFVTLAVSDGPCTVEGEHVDGPTEADLRGRLAGDFDGMDTNGDDQVSFPEAQTALPDLTRTVFGLVDLDHNGLISREEADVQQYGCTGCTGCTGCAGGQKASGMDKMRSVFGDLFLGGLCILALLAFGRMRP